MQLFNNKTINRHIAHADAPNIDKINILREWANNIASGQLLSQKETALAGEFKQKIMVEILGYAPSSQSGAWNIDVETQIGGGRVDLAIGQFTANKHEIIAPFELKGADTKNLDAIMAGRAKTPVDQAWEYASNNVGSKWVLVSNYMEIRLYSYADGKLAYENFDLRKLYEPHEYHRFMLLLSADNILSGQTLDILAQSKQEDKDITNALYADYKVLRGDLIGAVQTTQIDPLEAIGAAQTILDRILFIAFAEDNGLIPDNSIMGAYQHNDPYNPKPVWQNFLGLFTAIDQGNEALKIPKYNGGLFKRDPIIRKLQISDHICEGFKRLAEYDFASEISVTVLGHIFEQSIADVEALQAEALGETPAEKKASGTSGRRKRDGVVYTPDYVARFIVEQTLGTHCREIFERLLSQYAKKGAKPDDEEIAWKNKKSEVQFWQEYRTQITALRIVDPACGSGVFLVIAFDWLRSEITKCNLALETLGEPSLYETDSEILTNNLFGVDVNSESVEIAKLSLWIKTARRGKILDSLDGNIKVGDSLIEDSSIAYRNHGFEWKESFNTIFAEKNGVRGGFDIVLGNPPYVRMELIKPMKPWLSKRYEVAADRADLYAYFFERGLRLLKQGGRLGYISSSTFFKTGSGAPLRDYLRQNAAIESIVDFGDHQIFEGVTTYPVIITMRADAPNADHALQFWTIDDLPSENFGKAYAAHRQPYLQQALTNGSWKLENPALQALRHKIVGGKKTLKQVYGSPYSGIKTGFNKAFILSTEQKNELCKDVSSNKFLKKITFGNEVHKWRIEWNDKWLIYIPKGKYEIEDYPAISNWLRTFRQRLEKRAAKQNWYELQQPQERFSPAFESKKIVYRDIADRPTFSLDNGSYIDMTCFCIPKTDFYEVSLLNSNIYWFYLKSETTIASGGFYRMKSQYIEKLPIPDATSEQKAALAALAQAAQAAAEKRYALQQSITRRIPDLAADPSTAKLSNKLKSWWDLPDFAAFQKEVKKTLKSEIPLKERNEWDNWIAETRTDIHALSAKITQIEADINTQVYALFGLTADEITLLEANI